MDTNPSFSTPPDGMDELEYWAQTDQGKAYFAAILRDMEKNPVQGKGIMKFEVDSSENEARFPEPVPSIFTITALQSGYRSHRVWGWYPTLRECEIAVAKNYGGMDDQLYTWLVIEEVNRGVFATATVVAWYRWNSDDSSWASAPAPDWAEGTVNFGIG